MKSSVRSAIVWISLFVLVFVFYQQGTDTLDANLTNIPVQSGSVAEPVVVEYEPRVLSRLEVLRLLSDEFYSVPFVVNDNHIVRSALWSAVEDLDWEQDDQLLQGESDLTGQELERLLQSFWAASVTIESGVVTDQSFQTVMKRIFVERSRFVLSRARALELSVNILKRYDQSMWPDDDFIASDLAYQDVVDGEFVPYIRLAQQQSWIPRHWGAELLRPDAALTKQEALALVFDILGIEVPEGIDRSDYAYDQGLILRTEIGAYRLGKIIKYGEFKRLLLEASRLFVE